MIKRLFSGLSDPGLLRTSNQDSHYADPEGRFFIVADGMGGHAGGQEASRLATMAIRSHLETSWHSQLASATLLEQACAAANTAILQDQYEHPERADMGTTTVVLIFRDADMPWCAHVGDSRLYCLRGKQLQQVTEDHTWVASAIRAGEMSASESKQHPWRHVLSQCLGREDFTQAEVQRVAVGAGDRLLLCSDGLTEELPDQIIGAYLESDRGCETIAAGLVKGAKQRGGRDNITVIVIALTEMSESSSVLESQSGSPSRR